MELGFEHEEYFISVRMLDESEENGIQVRLKERENG